MNSVLRLVQTFTPQHYDLSITFKRQERSFDGTVSITGVLHAHTATIQLNAKKLTIQSALVDGKKAEFTLDAKNDILEITHKDLAEGKHVVTISYAGLITDAMNGVYPSRYTVDGTEHELVATQFESHYARQAFPCIDEPEAKATFDVMLKTEQGVTVLGNMPIKWQREEDGALVTAFERTPRMSTYLLAWVYGNLHKKTMATKNGTEVSIWATPAQAPQTLDFALGIATRVIDFFEDYFGIPYPLPKSDHVALPDFSAGAMENWGLVAYRETALLVDPKTTRLAAKQHVARVIAHELSHQWFGNLVTMKWWNDLWLNESFANIMEYISIDALEPSWNSWLDYATTEVMSAMQRDSIDGVQAIQVEVNHPDEISTVFDPSIVYAKGGRLIRMLQAHIGEPALRAGLQAYFTTHAYGNTEADDLWDALSEASGTDVGAFMHAWITQPGYPTVSVATDGASTTLTQSQFFIGPHHQSDVVWPIPLHANDPATPQILSEKSVSFDRSNKQALHLNDEATAHFITHYDAPSFAELLKTLDTLSVIDRLSLLYEQILLVRAGAQSAAVLIPLIGYFKEETNEAVWGSVAIAMNELRRYIEEDKTAEEHLKRLIRETIQFNYDRLGWDERANESENDTKLRATIIAFALYAELPAALSQATSLYTQHSPDELPPELRAVILAHAVRNAITPTVVDDLLRLHENTANIDLKEDITVALTSTHDTAVIQRLSELMKDTKVIRPQDFIHWFVWLLRNRYGRTYMWRWTRNEWDWLEETFGEDSHYEMFPRYIASSLISKQQYDEYRTFFEDKKQQPALTRNITIGYTELEGRVAIMEKNQAPVCTALRDLY